MRVILLLCLIALSACSASKSSTENEAYFQNGDKKYILADIDLNAVLTNFGESFNSKEATVMLDNWTLYSYNLTYDNLGLAFLVHSDDKLLSNNQIAETLRSDLNKITKVKEVRITNPDLKTNLEVKIGDTKEEVVEKYGSYTTPYGSLAYGNESVGFKIDKETGTVTMITFYKK